MRGKVYASEQKDAIQMEDYLVKNLYSMAHKEIYFGIRAKRSTRTFVMGCYFF